HANRMAAISIARLFVQAAPRIPHGRLDTKITGESADGRSRSAYRGWRGGEWHILMARGGERKEIASERSTTFTAPKINHPDPDRVLGIESAETWQSPLDYAATTARSRC